jgi:Tfp pilus assembly protein PilF
MFNRAIEIDPEYARAYAGVADSCSMLYMYFDAREFNIRQADIASQKALELEPELAEAHLARGIAVALSKRFDEAEREFETAMRLDPKLFEAPYFFGARALRRDVLQTQSSSSSAHRLLRPRIFRRLPSSLRATHRWA